jgi:signal transduction histidine kinase/CheY-like chemotaxis protein
MLNLNPMVDEGSITIKVLMDQVRSLEGASIASRIATFSMGALASWLCRSDENQNSLIVWISIQTLFNLAATWTTIKMAKVPVSDNNVMRRLRRSTIIPALNGVIWAVGIILMWVPGHLEIQLLVIFFIVGISSGSLQTLKPYLPALFLFFIPCVGSIVFCAFWYHDKNSVIVGIATSVYMAWCIGYSFTAHRELINSIYKHYEAAELTLKLQAQKEIAEAATQAKSRFLAAASHDMRQPMYALNLYLGALSNFNLPPAAIPVLSKVEECAHTMDEMFSALLDISRLDASILKTNISSVSVTDLLRKIHLEFSQQAQAKGLSFRIARCSVQISSDEELLENILRNLVSNAIKYTHRGRILIGCRRVNQKVRIGVYDTGIGIRDDQIQHIFEEFYQVENRERDRSQGLGLGLSIVQRQAQMLDAPLIVRSKFKCGSVFEIELPLCDLSTDVRKSIDVQNKKLNELPGTLIVVVDDEELILSATRLLLEQWGCSVVTANSGPEILQLLADCSRIPDAIISDHRLRNNETGVQVINAIRTEFNAEIPAVLITGDTSPYEFKLIAESGLPVLHKPLQSQTLKEKLYNLITNVIPD